MIEEETGGAGGDAIDEYPHPLMDADEAAALLSKSGDEYALSLSIRSSVRDIESLQGVGDPKVLIERMRSIDRRKMFLITRVEKHMGVIDPWVIELDKEHMDLVSEHRSMCDDLHARVDAAMKVAREPLPPQPRGLFHGKAKKEWNRQTNIRLYAQYEMANLEKDMRTADLEEIIRGHMLLQKAENAGGNSFEVVWRNVVAKNIKWVNKMREIEDLLNMNHPEDPAYLRSPKVMEFVHRIAREVEVEEGKSADTARGKLVREKGIIEEW